MTSFILKRAGWFQFVCTTKLSRTSCLECDVENDSEPTLTKPGKRVKRVMTSNNYGYICNLFSETQHVTTKEAGIYRLLLRSLLKAVGEGGPKMYFSKNYNSDI